MTSHTVGRLEEFPVGSHRVVRVGRAEIGVFNVGGRFYALPNTCPHQFGPLCTGTVGGTTACNADTGWKQAWVRTGEILTCPWHGIEFDITTGVCLSSPRLRVRTYPVTIEDGDVRITLERREA